MHSRKVCRRVLTKFVASCGKVPNCLIGSCSPFAAGDMQQCGRRGTAAAWPTAAYGIVLLLAGVAYYILVRALVALHGRTSGLARALGHQSKDKLSVLLYAAAIPLAFAYPRAADAPYVTVALMWLIPDRRIEKGTAR